STRAFGHKLDIDILGGLGKAVPYVLGLYFLLKIVDLGVSGELGLLVTAYPQNLLWWGEMIIGVILPIILFSLPAIRRSRKWIFWSAVLVILGLIINRFNVSMLALEMRPGYEYYPHWMEFAVSIGLVVVALIVFQIAIRVLPLTHLEESVTKDKEHTAPDKGVAAGTTNA
ncbi:MAG: hypothetical protein MUO90_00040, partial [Dehalococcoidales bacterium]|nr:hypothetical protein [Dehalococcoidales bacterium]